MSNICMFEFEDNVWDEFDENDDLIMTQNERMPEIDSCSHTPEGVFSSYDGNSYREAKRLTSDGTGMSDHYKRGNIDFGGSEICTDDTVLEDKCMVEDNSVCQYPINHTSQVDNELSFLDNDGWLDIGNFEDVDRMLSSDLTFGMGSLNNEEEFCWFPSSHDAEGSEDVLKSDIELHCAEMSPLKNISEYNMDSSKENIEVFSIKGSNKMSSPGDKIRSRMDVDDNGVPEKYADINQQFGASSSGVTSLDSIQRHKPNIGPDSIGCLLTQTPLTHPDFSHAPNHISLPSTFSRLRTEHDGHLSPSLIDSSYASNTKSSHGHSLETAALKTNEKREHYHNHGHLSSRSFINKRRESEMPFHSPGSSHQVAHQFESENDEGHSKVRGASLGFSSEINSSTVQESSPISSTQDQNSLEANSFSHLQQALDLLDIRTKLCIRDSLYRLAKSAEQRNNNSNANGWIEDATEACKDTMAQDANRCSGFMDIETNTNPIDRSIAHLLFHKPTDPSTLLPNSIAPFKSSATIHETAINQVKADNQVIQEDSSTNVEKKLLGGNNQ